MEIGNSKLIDVYDIIEKFLKPNEIQKKKNGEVFTPVSLIKEKCSKIPKEFWNNPNVKVLDPCCGIGNYPIVLIEYFMEGLKNVIVDDTERLKHIKENIIYCYDICPINVSLCKQITNIKNVYCEDFLEKTVSVKFDLVIGNPPYNDGSGNKGRGHTLWTKFIEISLKLIKDNGYFLYGDR